MLFRSTGFEKEPFVKEAPKAGAYSARPTVAAPVTPAPAPAPAAAAPQSRPVMEPEADNVELPSFVKEDRYVLPNRSDRGATRQRSLYGDRFGSDNAQSAETESDPFAEEAQDAKPKENAAPARRGFTSDIPPFLRGRRK